MNAAINRWKNVPINKDSVTPIVMLFMPKEEGCIKSVFKNLIQPKC